MKCSRKSVRTKENAIPQLRFEDQRLTSFAGLVVLQKFFRSSDSKRDCRNVFDIGLWGRSLIARRSSCN